MGALNLEINSDINSIGSAVFGVMQYLDELCPDIDDCLIFEIKVVLNELLVNSVKHGNKMDPNKKVLLRAGLTCSGYFYAYVEDEGAGYDYNKYLKQINLHSNISEIKGTGRGILIADKLCDRIKFNSKGNKIVVLKKVKES